MLKTQDLKLVRRDLYKDKITIKRRKKVTVIKL